MISRRCKILRLSTAFLLFLLPLQAVADNETLLDLAVDDQGGKLFLQLGDLPAEYLYIPAIQSGAGSNDLGLDRGKLDRNRRVRFERYGNRILLLEPNLAFRAETGNPAERRAVSEAFAQSVLAGFELEVTDDENVVKIDLSPLLLSDITRIAPLLAKIDQEEFELDQARFSYWLSSGISDAIGIVQSAFK